MFGSRIATPVWHRPREFFMLPPGLVGSISLAGIAHMNSSLTRAQVLFVVTLICGIVCLALAAIASGILAGGWMLNWLIPSLAFEHASIVAGTALTIATILVYGVANIMSEHILQKQKIEEEHDDDDDYSFDEELAERIAELTIAKLNRGMRQRSTPQKPVKSSVL